MLSSSLSLLLVLVSCHTVLGHYDDLSVLEEVLARTSMRPIIRQIPVQPTTTIIELLKETEEETTLEAISSVPTTEEVPSTVTVITTTQETTEAATESTTQSTEAPITTTTTEPPMTTTFSQIESTDSVDELFMGMKRPDLATIYRRLFPFRH